LKHGIHLIIKTGVLGAFLILDTHDIFEVLPFFLSNGIFDQKPFFDGFLVMDLGIAWLDRRLLVNVPMPLATL
jgi:hypothetical protein